MIRLPIDLSSLKKIKKPKVQLAVSAGAFLGIDIGTSALKIAELSRAGERLKLENYGEMKAPSFYEKPFRTFEKTTLLLSSQDVANAIRGIMEEAQIKTSRVAFSIPDFSTFFTAFELPAMTQEEVAQAVEYEARQHVPLPLLDITLDWQITAGRPATDKQKGTPLKILLVAVPNEVVNQYQQIASAAGLKLDAIEAEVFSFARASASYEKGVVVLVDIGAQSATVSIVEKGMVKLSHSFDMAGAEFTRRLAQSFHMEYEEAEKIKRQQGLEHSLVAGEQTAQEAQPSVKLILGPIIDLIIVEIEKISRAFKQEEGKDAEKIILAGGSALLPGLAEYIGYQVKEEIIISNPFESLVYPPILERHLKAMGPAWAVAIGVAKRGLE